MIRKFEMPWRAAYEAWASLGWVLAMLVLTVTVLSSNMPMGPYWYMMAAATFFFLLNMGNAWRIWSIKFALSGIGIEFINILFIKKIQKKNPKHVWLGYGFDWKNEHTQRVYEMKKLDPSCFFPPDLFLKAREVITGKKVASLNKDGVGAPWIHGVEPNEQELSMPFDNLIGNTLIIGTTRCGKTRLLDVLISQFVHQPTSAVIVFDPKGDIELLDNMKRAAHAAGRSKDMSVFQLARPSGSIRIDPMKNYNNLSELATRISSLMPSESGDGDSFSAFAWSVANAICLGLVEINDKPNILKLRQYIEGGVEPLLAKCLPAFFEKNSDTVKDWKNKSKEYISRCVKRNPDGSMPARDPTTKETLAGQLLMYEQIYKQMGAKFNSEAINALTNIYKHDVGHYGKMIVNFLPILTKLTTGEIAGLLSPDPNDIDDSRLATDMMSLINSQSIVYIGLNALADKTVASAIGAMLLSDLSACAAARYNFGSEEDKKRKVYLCVDEAAQVVNDPYIQILNMAGGSGFANVAATQTISDFTTRLGSEDKAKVMLGNFNNMFALRSKDRKTQDFIIETFGKSYVYSMQRAHGTNSSTEKNITHFGGTISEKISESLEEIFPPDLLGRLPNWQFMASVSGGRLIKGRVPILTE